MPDLSSRPVHVAKFGGSSVATADRILRIVDIMSEASSDARHFVVVSALGGVTDLLLQAIDEARARSGHHRDVLNTLAERHDEVLHAVAQPDEHAALQSQLAEVFRSLSELLDGVSLLRECTLRTQDAIMGMGERLSVPLIAAAFRSKGVPASGHEAIEFIRTDDSFGEANVQFDATRTLIQSYMAEQDPEEIAVVTGFIASTDTGVTTTLGRSGSDYTATLLAEALDAEKVIIWTDVDGVLSADPRLVPDAYPLPQLHYREAGEMAHFGAKVLHPRTMRPLQPREIPLYIKNTFNPEATGTLISAASSRRDGHIKAVTAIRNVAMVMIEGAGMVGVPGIAARAFGALAERRINVLLISQASSEQSICVVVRAADAAPAVESLELAFVVERSRGDVTGVRSVMDCAIVSVVGDYMRDRPGLAGRMFSTLGRSGVNVRAIAEGAADTNISAVVWDRDVPHALQALHEAFALNRDRAHVFVLGAGVVGSCLLDLLAKQAPSLIDDLKLNLRLVGVGNSRQLAWDKDGIPFEEATQRLEEADHPTNLEHLIQHLIDSKLERLIFVDATASSIVADTYERLLKHNIAVVTPNKRANSRSYAHYRALKEQAHAHQVPYLYETTVGAGLPVVSTLRDLLRAGDQVVRIEGVLSGTLAFVFNALADGTSFAEAVREAHRRGFTEPDPRDDLKGEDVARKLLILAREMGLTIEREAVDVEALVPDELATVSAETFMDRLDTLDASWAERVQEAAADDKRLVYAGQIHNDKLQVKVIAVDASHPFYSLQGTDNMVAFYTNRYLKQPLIIRGPGAGPEVTAAGVLADIIRAAELVG